MALTRVEVEQSEDFAKCVSRGFISVDGNRITYHVAVKSEQAWNDPEEWVRAKTICFLILDCGYPTNRIRVELTVPRRVPSDSADIVVFADDRCRDPYLVVECKKDRATKAERDQGIEQLFGNCNSLRAKLGLFDQNSVSILFDVARHPPMERTANRLGDRLQTPAQYGQVPDYAFVAGSPTNGIRPADQKGLETRIRRAHSLIWSGGKRDPLNAFDEWSKLLFAKVRDERGTPNGEPMKFQVGTGETTATVANRVHDLFNEAKRDDPAIFPEATRIDLPDKKVFDVVRVIQDISISDTGADTIGRAFESFFGGIFRGELGQYFTMRPIARFVVSALDVNRKNYVIDPTAGSGGFLLEVLLQVWHRIATDFAGRRDYERIRNDFAFGHVYGIEIHEVLARICKINLLLHHDGHTNIEANRSCLDSTFTLPRLNPPFEKFDVVVGNPPFGDEIDDGDEDTLGENELGNFEVSRGRDSVPSEHVIIERAVDLLVPGGVLGFVLPDGLFNNQGEVSNCPRVRRFLARRGYLEGIVSLPDHAFRVSGAQNKTSILFFRKYTRSEKTRFNGAFDAAVDLGGSEDDGIAAGLDALNYFVFLAEALSVGYTTTGASSLANDLFGANAEGLVDANQQGTILGEFQLFRTEGEHYRGHTKPDCMAIRASDLWRSHVSHRLDPKYFLFKREERHVVPAHWVKTNIGAVMVRRIEPGAPEARPDELAAVMTIGQTGEIRPRQAGKGRNPPTWLGMYFEPGKWFVAHQSDVVFSSIDLWKGCISVVPEDFEGALVSKEFPIYRIVDDRLLPEFLSALLRTRYYQRAFRAITTGHSNRRRTQPEDFEALEIAFPPTHEEQRRMLSDLLDGKGKLRAAGEFMRHALIAFSDSIDGRGDEELPEVEAGELDDNV